MKQMRECLCRRNGFYKGPMGDSVWQIGETMSERGRMSSVRVLVITK